ncbi:MAG: HD domain-containing protein [Anaerolineales bacterium]|nr:HD domain-containing protein [Anaerolineales bacterium]
MRRVTLADIPYRQILSAWNVRGERDYGVLGVAFAENFLVRLSQQTWIQVLIWAAIVLFMVLEVGLFIAQRFSRPIVNLQQAAIKVSQGNFAVAVEPVGHDEVAALTTEFNKMVGRLKNARTDIVTAYDRTLLGWAKALELRDGETEGHSQRVTALTVRLAEMMGVDKKQIVHIRRGALLHDIGKMAIPDSILLKPGKLTEEEWQIMRQHPTYAVEMLKNIPFLQPALDIPKYHHEKWDGSGYPSGLKGEEIPLPARIFSIVDYWDALLSNRPYRASMSVEKVTALIHQEKGQHFDPAVVEMFFQMLKTLKSEGPDQDEPNA